MTRTHNEFIRKVRGHGIENHNSFLKAVEYGIVKDIKLNGEDKNKKET